MLLLLKIVLWNQAQRQQPASVNYSTSTSMSASTWARVRLGLRLVLFLKFWRFHTYRLHIDFSRSHINTTMGQTNDWLTSINCPVILVWPLWNHWCTSNFLFTFNQHLFLICHWCATDMYFITVCLYIRPAVCIASVNLCIRLELVWYFTYLSNYYITVSGWRTKIATDFFDKK